MKGYIHSIETFGAVDGPGIRYVIFMQGCFYRCQYCHNPDTWKLKEGKITTVRKLVKDIKPYINYIKDGGVTISGGEPLIQAEFVYKLIKKLKRLNIHVAVDTAGSIPIEKSKKVLDVASLILLDVKSLDNALNKEITGYDNLNTLNTLKYCEEKNKDVWIRHVVVPSLTFSEEKLEELAKFLTNYKCIKNIELIPFHKMGEYKWKELNLDYKLYDVPATNQDQMKIVKKIFEKYKLPIKK